MDNKKIRAVKREVINMEKSEQMQSETVAKNPSKKKKHKDLNRAQGAYFLIVGIFLVVYSITLFIPLAWGAISSFKGVIDFQLNKFGLPEVWKWDNYLLVFQVMAVQVEAGAGFRMVYIPEMIMNSIVYSFGTTFVTMFVLYCIAYISARFPYKWTKFFYYVNIFAMVFPLVGSTASNLAVAHQLHLIDNMLGLFLIQAHFIGGMTFMVLHAQLEALPKDFSDAAYIDGAGDLRIMFTIIFPMVSTTVFTYAFYPFIMKWNDYCIPLFYILHIPTIAYGIYDFNLGGGNNGGGTSTTNVPVTIAACLEATLPTFLMFLLFQKRLLGNFAVGGIKE